MSSLGENKSGKKNSNLHHSRIETKGASEALCEILVQAQRMAGVGIWRYDACNNEIIWSEGVYRIFDIAPKDFNQDYQSYINLIHHDDQIKVYSAVEGCLTGKPYEIECRILLSDGKEKFVHSKGEPVFKEGRKVVGIIGTIQDITEKKLLEAELKRNCKNLAQAQALAHIGSWESDIATGKNSWSEETYRIFGITHGQYDGTYEGFLKFVHPDDRNLIRNILKNPPEKQPFDIEYRIIKSDGSVRNVYQIVEIEYDKEGNPAHFYGTIQDITEKKESQRELEYKQETINNIQRRFQVLVQESNDVIEIISHEGIIKYVSPAVKRVLGFDPDELTGKNIFEFTEGEERSKLGHLLELALNSTHKNIKGDIAINTKWGKKVYIEGTISNLLPEPSIHGIVINWRDITERIENQREIEYIATHDELTKLPNSIFFSRQIAIQCERGESFAVMMLEIDRFKHVNDTLGYSIGDKLIIKIGDMLANHLDGHGLVCRYSGDRFAIIVSEASTIDGYVKISRSVINLFSRPIRVDMYELSISVNIGISIYPDDGRDMDSLKKHANIALLRAGNEGKNSCGFYSSDMDIQNHNQFVLQNDLYKAIEEEQFRVYYQPQVDLQTCEILGAEALIRWEHPTRGLVMPGEFIFLAEETGLIVNLGHWLLREVCRNHKKWLDSGLPDIKVSVNYSGIQLFEKDLIKKIKDTIDEFRLNPHFLIIEITETALMKNTEKVIEDIQNLQALGIQVALDDFGTGFSSLSYLNSFRVDIFKIDQSFIKNIPFDKTSMIITRSVINLARELGIKLIAEGIEKLEQLYCLKSLCCCMGQGYIYSKPIPVKEFEKMLADGKCMPNQAGSIGI